MAERTVVRKMFTFPLPEDLSDETAAAIVNPGVSAWLTLAGRAKLAAGENVLILGATGVTGQLAIRIAKLLGASRVVAAGRNPEILSRLQSLGADAVIQLDVPASQLSDAFAREAGTAGFQVVIDYVWGQPAEAFFAAITRKEFAAIESETRYVQVGEGAGPTITLPAAVLRSYSGDDHGDGRNAAARDAYGRNEQGVGTCGQRGIEDRDGARAAGRD